MYVVMAIKKINRKKVEPRDNINCICKIIVMEYLEYIDFGQY